MPFCEANFVYLLRIIFIFISRQKRKNQRTTTSRVPLLRQRSAILFTRGTHYPSNNFPFFNLSFRVKRIFSKYKIINIGNTFFLSVQLSRSKNMETVPSRPAVCEIPVENFCSSLTLTTQRKINAGNGGTR